MFAANAGAVQSNGKTYIEDVFGAYVFDGTGASKTITDNIDRTKGALDIFKRRDSAVDWAWTSTALGLQKALCSNSTAGQTTDTSGVTAVSSTGITFGADSKYNASGGKFEKVTFRNALNFFQELLVTKAAGSNLVIDLSQYFPSSLLGMVKVKRTDAAGSWYVWHRSLTAGKLLIGETTAGETTLGQITVSGKTLTLVDGVIANGTYHIEAYAHDTSADGLIQCGSFTPDGSANFSVNPGWETQLVLIKRTDAAQNWTLLDTMRGWPTLGAQSYSLNPNLSSAEGTYATTLYPTATGFASNGTLTAGANFVYLAIRRGPMRKPTSGTQVFYAAATGSDPITTGFPVDLAVFTARAGGSKYFADRLRGGTTAAWNFLQSDSAAAEYTGTGGGVGFDNPTGLRNNWSSGAYAWWLLRRYPGVLDQICYGGTGTNKTEPHNLTVQPELWRAKRRDNNGNWVMGSTLLGADEKILLNSTAGKVTDATAWSSTYPTASSVSLGTLADVNASGGTFTMYLYATTPGVSKVGRIACTGADMNIDAGFAAGARYIEIFRDDGTSSRYVFDSTRGIVAGNDPYLCLDSTAAEVTSTDYIDPYAAGFTVTAAAPWNVAGARALYFAIA